MQHSAAVGQFKHHAINSRRAALPERSARHKPHFLDGAWVVEEVAFYAFPVSLEKRHPRYEQCENEDDQWQKGQFPFTVIM